MALVRSLEVEGVTYPDAYSRILFVRFEKDQAYIFINTYADEAARMREDMPVLQEQFVTTMATVSGTVYGAAYTYVRTLPEFANAINWPDPDDLSPVAQA